MTDRTDNLSTSTTNPRPSSSNKAPSSKDTSSRHSPIAPLAPLEYLQNQRRGSITDPSLHAAPHNSTAKQNMQSFRQQPEPIHPNPSALSGTSSAHQESHTKNISSDPRPSSPYIFGDATSHAIDNNAQIRKLLRSPSMEHDSSRMSSVLTHDEPPRSNELSSRDNVGHSEHSEIQEAAHSNDVDQMNVDKQRLEQQFLADPSHSITREPQQFDYNMRRHSIAVGQNPHDQPSGSQPSSTPHGTKRKMSTDRGIFPIVGEEIDPQLVGPGVPSLDMDTEAPAPKRRGSAIDTQRIAQLSLNDRRNSVDSRGTQWWMNDRRDPSAPMFSNVSVYTSGFPGGDSQHGKPPPGIATFAWPANTHPSDHQGVSSMQSEGDANMASLPRTFDPNAPLSMMPPVNFAPERRMSISDAVASASGGPTRILRSRSRPPSRQMRSAEPPNPSAPTSGQDDVTSAPSPTGSGKQSKESSATPYSRSPELRISHKLAERKRRKEMKDLFDELRDQLPADRGMKASKWEILSKAIDFVAQLKQSHQDMAREIDILRHELDAIRQGGIPPFPVGPPPHAVVYGQVPPAPGPYPPPPPGTVQQHPPPHPLSRPNSSQNVFPPGGGPPPSQNGHMNRAEAPPT